MFNCRFYCSGSRIIVCIVYFKDLSKCDVKPTNQECIRIMLVTRYFYNVIIISLAWVGIKFNGDSSKPKRKKNVKNIKKNGRNLTWGIIISYELHCFSYFMGARHVFYTHNEFIEFKVWSFSFFYEQ